MPLASVQHKHAIVIRAQAIDHMYGSQEEARHLQHQRQNVLGQTSAAVEVVSPEKHMALHGFQSHSLKELLAKMS